MDSGWVKSSHNIASNAILESRFMKLWSFIHPHLLPQPATYTSAASLMNRIKFRSQAAVRDHIREVMKRSAIFLGVWWWERCCCFLLLVSWGRPLKFWVCECNCCLFFWVGGWCRLVLLLPNSLAGEGVLIQAWKTRMCRAEVTQWPRHLFEASPASRACKWWRKNMSTVWFALVMFCKKGDFIVRKPMSARVFF